MFINSELNENQVYSVFSEIIEKELKKLLSSNSSSKLVINENFSILFADEILKLHPNSKIILTIRHPFDVYADSFRVGWLAMPYDINKFLKWQWSMFNQVQKILKKNPKKFLFSLLKILLIIMKNHITIFLIF